jgi:pimeloyl-ACP methyl ester carboxylesterase
LLVAAVLPGPAYAADRECRGIDVPAEVGTIHGTLCTPAGVKPETVMVLEPGATYNSVYWDFPYQPDTYSYSLAMNSGGYATLALDPLGTGRSSHPLGALLTSTAQAQAIHAVIQEARQTFQHVILTGHSLGSAVAVMEAATYHDVDALAVTGLQHRINVLTTTKLFTTDFIPAPLDPVLGSRPGYDLTELTTAPGHRYSAFHAPGQVDPKVIEVDEATKDAFATTGAPDAIGLGILTAYSASVDVPVLVAIGQYDEAFCGFLTMTCTQEGVRTTELPYYPKAPSLTTYVLPASGHDLNLNPYAPALHHAVLTWANNLQL